MLFCLNPQKNLKNLLIKVMTDKFDDAYKTIGEVAKILNLKSKKKWNVATNTFETGTDDTLYEEEMVLDYVQDLIFVPFDANGKQIGNQDPGNVVPGLANIEDLRTVDIALIVRSTKPFYRENKNREVTSIYDSERKIDHKTDRYLREIITVTANARNAGL